MAETGRAAPILTCSRDVRPPFLLVALEPQLHPPSRGLVKHAPENAVAKSVRSSVVSDVASRFDARNRAPARRAGH